MNFYDWLLIENTQAIDLYAAVMTEPYNSDLWFILADYLEEQGDNLHTFIRAVIARRTAEKGQLSRLNAIISDNWYNLSRQGVSHVEVAGNGKLFFYRNNSERMEWYGQETCGSFWRTHMDDHQWQEMCVPAGTLIHSLRLPSRWQNLNANDPNHPENWEFPFIGNSVQPSEGLFRRVIISLLLNFMPSHLYRRWQRYQRSRRR